MPITDIASSFDHLVSAGDESPGDGDPEHPGGLLVEDETELGRLNDRQVRGLCTFENAGRVNPGLMIRISDAASPIEPSPSERRSVLV